MSEPVLLCPTCGGHVEALTSEQGTVVGVERFGRPLPANGGVLPPGEPIPTHLDGRRVTWIGPSGVWRHTVSPCGHEVQPSADGSLEFAVAPTSDRSV